MADAYEIQYEGKTVGSVRMEKQGLYHCFHCRCTLPDEGMYRIHVVSGDNREDLGICIPAEGKFGMDKKIPSKRLGDGALAFQLLPKDWLPVEPVVEPVAEPELPVAEEIFTEPESELAEETEVTEPIFVAVSEEEPFHQLSLLENAVMEVRDDQVGVLIQE